MRKSIILSSVLALGVTFVSVDLLAQRQGGPNRGGGGRGEGGPAVSDANQTGARRGVVRGRAGLFGGGAFGLPGGNLNLTDEQRTKVQQIVTSSRDKTGPIADELRLATSTLRRELFADAPDKAKVTELSGKVATLRGQINSIQLETTSAIASLLTPDQREKARTGGGRMGGRMGRGRG